MTAAKPAGDKPAEKTTEKPAERKLAVNVTHDGVTYRAGTVPPGDVAAQITNPKAWGDTA